MSEERDMGPFSGMAPDLVEAISRYGTPPYRQTVNISVREVSDYSFADLPTDIDGWIGWMEAVRQEAPEEYRADLNCVLQFDRGYYDSGTSAELSVWYERAETDDEMKVRVGRGIAYVVKRADDERRQYEALRAKFEQAR